MMHEIYNMRSKIVHGDKIPVQIRLEKKITGDGEGSGDPRTRLTELDNDISGTVGEVWVKGHHTPEH